MVGSSSNPMSLKDYLKKYTSNDDDKEKKRKKKWKEKPDAAGVVVVDEDPIWQKPVKVDDEEDSADEEKPQVDEDIEVKCMKRLEQLRSTRPFGVISEDGSGWVSVPTNPNSMKSENQSSDISPPRKRRPMDDTPSPKSQHVATSRPGGDLSPPRQLSSHYKRPQEPEEKESHYQSGRKVRYDTPSPERQMKDAGSDVATDLSPSCREQRDKPASSPGGDLSPPRQSHKRYQNSPRELERKASHYPGGSRKHHDSPSPEWHLKDEAFHAATDLSPPRRQERDKRASSPEPGKISLHSKAGADLDISPPRRARPASKYQDNSRASSAADLSPPRKTKNDRSNSIVSLDTANPAPSVSDLSPPRKTRKGSPISSRPKTGLISGEDIRDEIDRKRKEDFLRFKQMDPSVSGRGADAIYRNKLTGERMSKEDFLKAREKKRKKEEKPKEKKLEWSKGLAQKREAEARMQEIEAEKEKPFARSRDDPELDAMLKERVRWGDPMAHLVKKKQNEPVLPDLGDGEKMKESGFIIPQEIPSHSWIRRGLDAAPNRYGIKPGRHWDGVDRSTGYEKEFFKRMNERKATETEAYLWSVADM